MMPGADALMRLRPGAWAAYAACALAFLHAAVSFYWAGGGAAGLSTIGGTLEELGRTREPALIAVVWAVGVLKALAGLLALALVRPWGRALPRWPLLAAAWGGAALLIAYGGLFTLGGVLVVTGVIPASGTADWTAAPVACVLVGPVVSGLGAPARRGGVAPYARDLIVA